VEVAAGSTATQDRFVAGWRGLQVEVVTQGFEGEALARALLSPPFHLVTGVADHRDLVLRVRRDPAVDRYRASPHAGAGPLTFEVLDRSPEATRIAGVPWDPSLGAFLLASRRSPPEWDVAISPSRPLSERWVPDLVKLFASTSVQAAGSRFMHCSAVATGDEALLFAGDSGVGKTTLALLACLRGGARLIADEIAALASGDAGIDVCCWPGCVGVAPQTELVARRQIDPGFRSRTEGLRAPDLVDRGKRLLDWDEYLTVMGLAAQPEAPLRATVALRPSDRRGWRISLADRARAVGLLRALWRDSTAVPWLFEPVGLVDHPVGPSVGPELVAAHPVVEVDLGSGVAEDFEPFWHELVGCISTA
jgi:hypothetical protein